MQLKPKLIWQVGGLAVLLAGCGRAHQDAMTDASPTQFVSTSVSEVASTVLEQAATDDARVTHEARTVFATQFAATARAERTQVAADASLVEPDFPVPPSVDVEAAFPLAWPAPALTQEQILAAEECNISSRVFEHFAGTSVADLEALVLPETACEWGMLAKAYEMALEGEQLPAAGREAFMRTVYGNPALAVTDGALSPAYGNGLMLVDNPPISAGVSTIAIFAEFWGSDGYGTGLWLEYALFINVGAGETATVRGNAYSHDRHPEQRYSIVTVHVPIATEVDAALADSLVASFGNLWPTDMLFLPLAQTTCEGMLAQGRTRALIALTNGQTILVNAAGMPYEGGGSGTLVTLDGQNYVQLSTQFYDSLMRMLAGAGAPGPAVAAEVGAVNCQ